MKNTKTIGEIRKQLDLSQADLARLLDKSQATVSREEASNKVLVGSELMKIESLGLLLEEKPLDGAVKKATKAQALVMDLQEITGELMGAAMDKLLPRRIKSGILKRLSYEQVFFTEDKDLEQKEAKAASVGDLGHRVVMADSRIRVAVKEKRWQDVLLMAQPILELIDNAPVGAKEALLPIYIKILHNHTLAVEIHDRKFQDARNVFDRIFKHPSADPRDRAVALYEKGFTFLEEHARSTQLTTVIRKDFAQAHEWFLVSHKIDPTNPFMGIALLDLADKVLELGDQNWCRELISDAEKVFNLCDLSLAKKEFKTREDIRKRWPNLSSKHGLIKTALSWIGLLLLTVIPLICGATPDGAVVAHQGNMAPVVAHQGNMAAPARIDQSPRCGFLA